MCLLGWLLAPAPGQPLLPFEAWGARHRGQHACFHACFQLSLEAWRDPQKLCAGDLFPFPQERWVNHPSAELLSTCPVPDLEDAAGP